MLELKTIVKDITKFEAERIFWLRLSGFVVIAVLGVVFCWDSIQINHLQWIFLVSGLSISVVWWYWTMRLIRQTLQHRRQEVEILYDIVQSIRELKNSIAKDDK